MTRLMIPTDRAVLLKPRSKAPATRTWPMNPDGWVRHTREEIQTHEGNLGCICGKPLGSEFDLWVLDLDHKAGGLDALQALEEAHGNIPGHRVRTGGGGLHIYLEGRPKEASCRLPVAGTDLQVELKAEGAYVVAPFSVHPEGGVYEPEEPGAWIDRGWPVFPPAPDWLVRLAATSTTTPSAVPKRGGTRLAPGEPPPSVYVPALTGQDISPEGNVLCPAHEDTKGSLHIYADHWHCFGCGLTGRARQLAAVVLGVGGRQGGRWRVDGEDRETADTYWREATS